MNTRRWMVAILLCLATMINYIDRQALGVVSKELRGEFTLDERDYGQIVALFMVGYAIMYAVSGYLVDRLGTRRGASVFIFLWSLAQMLHAFTVGKWSLGGARLLLGLAEPGNWPAAAKAVKEWFPVERRALGIGVFNAGSALGSTIAAPVVGGLAIAYGWRAAFVVTGAFGLAWLVAWLIIYRPGPFAEPPSNETVDWRKVITARGCWTLILARFFTDPVVYFMMFWLPEYLRKERGFDLAMVTRYGWIPFVAADAGYLLGGWLSGALIDRGWPVAKARKFVMLLGACCLPPAMLAPLVPEAWMAIVAMCSVMLGHALWVSNELTIPTDVFQGREVGTASGLSGMGGAIGGVIANLGTGYVVSAFSYAPVFILIGCLHPFAMFLVWRLLPDKEFEK